METARSTLILVTGIFLWVLFFVFGITLDAGSYFTKISGPDSGIWTVVGSVFGFFLSWTWSNLVMLCCLAALVGEVGRDAMANGKGKPNLRGAMVRGFFIYLAITAGQLVIAGNISLPKEALESVTNGSSITSPLVTTPSQYFRLASFCSLVAFLVGFTPKLFTSILNSVSRMTGTDE